MNKNATSSYEEMEELEEELEALIPTYGSLDFELKNIKKKADGFKERIKTIVKSLGVKTYRSEDYEITYTEAERVSFKEDKLLTKLKEIVIDKNSETFEGLIKTKEYVDMDVLENLLYHNKFDEADISSISDCQEIKIIPTLKVKKVKK